jgi:hypothetical protein
MAWNPGWREISIRDEPARDEGALIADVLPLRKHSQRAAGGTLAKA